MTCPRALVAALLVGAALTAGCGGDVAQERPAAGPSRAAPARVSEPIREYFVPGALGRDQTVGADAAVGLSAAGGPVRLPTVVEAECEDFQTQAAAQAALRGRPAGPHRLDQDGNGIACDGLAGPFDGVPVLR